MAVEPENVSDAERQLEDVLASYLRAVDAGRRPTPMS